MKILLVAPCYTNEQRHKTMDVPQLTLSLIAGMTPPEHEIEICEEVFGDIINFDGDYDVVGITIMTQTCMRGYEIANEFKKRDVTVVFGGIHATCLPHEAIKYGDAVVIGEAEGGLWESVLHDIEKNKLRDFYKLEALPDMQHASFPRRDMIRCKAGLFSLAPIETTRGCPYNCDFCTVSRFFGTKQRHKSIKNIISEIESCSQKYMFFMDDNITIDKKFARELFRNMAPLNKIWGGQTSINLANDKELMELAYKAGCRALLIGFESMTQKGMDHYHKSLKSIDENVSAVKKLRDNGILTMASLVFGLDNDSKEVFSTAYEFLTRSKAAFFQSCLATPYPGTPIFEKMKSENRILTDDWRKYDATKVIVRPKNFSPEELLEGSNNLQQKIYSNTSILKRSFPNLRAGFAPSMFYFSLNKGYQSRFKQKKVLGVQHNAEGMPVDFDVTKYIPPQKITETTIEMNEPELMVAS